MGLWDCGIVGSWLWERLRSADAGPYSAGGSAGGKYKELIEEVFSISLDRARELFWMKPTLNFIVWKWLTLWGISQMEVLVVSGCVKVVRLLSPMRLSDSPDPSCTFALILKSSWYVWWHIKTPYDSEFQWIILFSWIDSVKVSIYGELSYSGSIALPRIHGIQ